MQPRTVRLDENKPVLSDYLTKKDLEDYVMQMIDWRFYTMCREITNDLNKCLHCELRYKCWTERD